MISINRARISALAALTVGIGLAAGPAVLQPSPAAAVADQPGDIIWQEDFDRLAEAFGPRVNDPDIAPGTVGFTHEPPPGWSVDNTRFSGGVEEWRGWSFTTKEFWNDADLQQRNWFSGAHDVIAVVDGDEWSDAGAPAGRMDTGLTTETIDVSGRDAVELSFTSHYRSVASQEAKVLVSFDDGPPQEVLHYSADANADNHGRDVQSKRERLLVDVPPGAHAARITWHYEAGNDWFWAIDDVALAVPLADATSTAGTVIDVLSDVQGDEPDYTMVMEKLNAMTERSAATVINGDVTADGTLAQTSVFKDAAAETPPSSGRLLLNFGNHDDHSPVANFYDLAGRDVLWDEQVVDGIPLLFVSSDLLLHQLDDGAYDEQLAWLTERLAFWANSGKPVLLFAHHNLADSVSGSYAPNYSGQWSRADELTDIVAAYANTFLFTSHTHWDLALDDWFARRVFAGGDPRGLPIFNTGSVQTKWGPSGDFGETNFGQQEATGLRVTVLEDRVRVDAHDFLRDEIVQSVDVPLATPHAKPDLRVETTPGAPNGENGWFTHTVSIALASDGSDVRGEVRIDDGVWAPFSEPITVSGDGAHTIATRGSVDNWRQPASSHEVKVDETAPISNARLDLDERTVALRALDATAGVARIEYRIGDGAFTPYSEPLMIGQAATTVEYRALDNAGNVEVENIATMRAADGGGDGGAGPGSPGGSGAAGAGTGDRLSETGTNPSAWFAAAMIAVVLGGGAHLLRRRSVGLPD